MPKFKVLTPLEHNQKRYLPQTDSAPETVKSSGHGLDIPVDASGVIDLSEEDAGKLPPGTVEAVKAKKAEKAEKAEK